MTGVMFSLSTVSHFWATVCKTVRPMLSDRCLSCPVCPVCDVGVLWPNGWTHQDETWHAGRPRPGHIVLDGDPGPLPQRCTAPNFRPISVVAKWLVGSRCHTYSPQYFANAPVGEVLTELGLIGQSRLSARRSNRR